MDTNFVTLVRVPRTAAQVLKEARNRSQYGAGLTGEPDVDLTGLIARLEALDPNELVSYTVAYIPPGGQYPSGREVREIGRLYATEVKGGAVTGTEWVPVDHVAAAVEDDVLAEALRAAELLVGSSDAHHGVEELPHYTKL